MCPSPFRVSISVPTPISISPSLAFRVTLDSFRPARGKQQALGSSSRGELPGTGCLCPLLAGCSCLLAWSSLLAPPKCMKTKPHTKDGWGKEESDRSPKGHPHSIPPALNIQLATWQEHRSYLAGLPAIHWVFRCVQLTIVQTVTKWEA